MSQKLFSKLSENSGPAFLNREPVVLPEHRKKFVQNLRNRMNTNQG